MSKVKIIAHPESGKLFTETSKDGWVKCQLQSEELVTSPKGVITKQKRTAFPLLSKDAVEMMSGLKNGSVFPLEGKIVRKLTSEPQFEGHQAVLNPETKETMDYYQTYTFTTDMSLYDVDEREVVKETSNASAQMEPNAAFDGQV